MPSNWSNIPLANTWHGCLTSSLSATAKAWLLQSGGNAAIGTEPATLCECVVNFSCVPRYVQSTLCHGAPWQDRQTVSGQLGGRIAIKYWYNIDSFLSYFRLQRVQCQGYCNYMWWLHIFFNHCNYDLDIIKTCILHITSTDSGLEASVETLCVVSLGHLALKSRAKLKYSVF